MTVQQVTKTVHRSTYAAIDPTKPSNSTRGKVVIISGGAGGIGHAIARGFCKSGARIVILLGRRQHPLEATATSLNSEYGTDVWTYSVDICSTEAVNSTFETIRERLKVKEGISDADTLVACAAVLEQGENILDFGAQDVRHSFDTNVFGNLNLVRAFLEPQKALIPKGLAFGVALGATKEVDTESTTIPSKVIVDVSSAAIHMQVPGASLYSTSKLAFTHVMRHLQSELDRLPNAPIRIHSFHPGAILTPGTRALGLDENSYPWDDESLPEGFAVWLTSPAAAFLKGRFIWSSWDVDELIEMREVFEKDPEFCTVSLKQDVR